MDNQQKRTAPHCLSIVVCEAAVEDTRTRNKSLFNTFNCIFSQKFPCIHAKLTVYASLTDGYGTAPIVLKLINDKTQYVITEIPGEIRFDNPLDVADILIELQNVPFPEPGAYTIQLTYGGDTPAERRIMAKLIEQAPDGTVRVVEEKE